MNRPFAIENISGHDCAMFVERAVDELADRPAIFRVVDNAYRLHGDLLLIVGEMDTNMDPSSTMQVAHQLLKHNKDFDLLVVPGANHPAARGDQYAEYGDHKRYDFFVRHLLGMMPP